MAATTEGRKPLSPYDKMKVRQNTMKKSNRKNVRYEHNGKRFSSYRDFMKSVHKSEYDTHNWKETTGFFSGILLKPVGNRRHKQFSKAGYWVNEYWNRIQEERSRACWGGPLY